MRIVQTVFGVYHHFELARELRRRGHLTSVYSTWPWARLQREGLPRESVQTFPWLHVPEYLLHRFQVPVPGLTDALGHANALAFDRWVERKLPAAGQVDALIGISGSSLRAGTAVQRRGGVFVCDRGSTHPRVQERLMGEEYARWGVERRPADMWDTVREEAIFVAAAAVVVPSTTAARSFLEMGIPAAKVKTIPFGVRLESFAPVGEPPADEFCVVFAGAVCLRKGVPYLLQAFAKLNHPRKKLRVVGPMQPDLKQVLGRLPTADVEFLGHLPQDKLAAVMSRSHVMVMPSIEEGLALVQAQALACGCPVVCSEASGGTELLTDGVEGFVVPIRDPEAIAERLQRLADDPELQTTMREAAITRVRSMGGWADYGERWEALLQELLGRSG